MNLKTVPKPLIDKRTKEQIVTKDGRPKWKLHVYIRYGDGQSHNPKVFFYEPATTKEEIEHNRKAKLDLEEEKENLEHRIRKWSFVHPNKQAVSVMDRYAEYLDAQRKTLKAEGTLVTYAGTRDAFGEFLEFCTPPSYRRKLSKQELLERQEKHKRLPKKLKANRERLVDYERDVQETYPKTCALLRKHKGNLPAVEVTPDVVRDFQHWLLNHLRLSKNTVTTKLRHLSSAFNHMLWEKQIEMNPFHRIRPSDRVHPDYESRSNPELRSKHFFSLDEIKAIYDNRYNRKRREEKDTTLAWCFACMIGARVSDVAKLKRENIKTMEVDGADVVYLDFRQGKKRQLQVMVPLNASALEILAEVKKRNPEYDRRLFRVKSNKDNKGMIARAGLDVDKLRFHNSRHSFGQNLRDAGVEDWVIDVLMGKKFAKSDVQHIHYNDTLENKPKIFIEAVSKINFIK